MKVSPVSFRNREGHRLFGMIHEPAARRSDVVVVLLTPGIKMRVGPNRLYVHMTEAIVDQGFRVFRFDAAGLGDSEGDIEAGSAAAVYNSIQSGRLVPDTHDALDYLEREHGAGRFVVGGLCGAAVTGLLAAAEDERVVGLLSLGIPVAFEGGEEDFARFVTQGQLEEMRATYLGKLLDWRAWLRLLTLRSDLRVIVKLVRKMVRERLHGPDAPPPLDDAALGNVNPKFAPAFTTVLERGQRILLVFSGADRLGWEFEEKFHARHAGRLAQFGERYEIHTVDGANHVFSKPQWREEMQAHVNRWLSPWRDVERMQARESSLAAR